ncbi:MAG: hypothetical protein K0R34_3403 [Herbinix sp.]|jgi:uncharacterized 2Fe-2S/4Fe-4S cluster protein (DUF4445 family)|nr:hypothetical protein [Herbinix sp.]
MGRIHPIKVWNNNKMIQIECSEDENLLDAMRRQGIPYYSDCGGRGTCGKCKIRILSGSVETGPKVVKILSATEQEEGYRLACRAIPKSELVIKLASYDESLKAVITAKDISPYNPTKDRIEEGFAVAIDLGTTTLAFQIVNRNTGEILASLSRMNPQRRLGADVISRMKASNDGRKEQLRQLILDALLEGIEELRTEASVPLDKLRHISIAGNTTMIHLLMGYSCEALGKYPFQPNHTGIIRKDFSEFFREVWRQRKILWEENSIDNTSGIGVTVLPGISAFVGSDIVAGLGMCGLDNTKEVCLFLDLGTNGELAIGNKDKLLVTSTAAGPAFEGGNISIGMGSVPGAISKFSLKDGKTHLETIGGQKPIGLCGTGVIELCSELLKNEIMDATGLLREDYFENGFLVDQEEGKQLRFLQRDIRELQLAKAAIRAGIELLIKKYGCTYEEIDKVYLAGGFGYVLPVEKAVHIGLLPEQLKEKIVAIGNSSLAGATRYLIDPEFSAKLDLLIGIAKEIHIANEEEFQELYIQYMNFAPGED